jgi:hypothetical protein
MALRKHLLGVLPLLAVLSCEGDGRKRCSGSGDPGERGQGEVCLWLHKGDGSGYVCAVTCQDDHTCPGGGSCKIGGASSCATCMDLVDICE